MVLLIGVSPNSDISSHLDWTFGPPVTAQVTGNRCYTSSHENKIGLAAAVYRLAAVRGNSAWLNFSQA